jgi:hypothetical protein
MKKHIALPLVLLIYLAFMAYTFYPGKNPELSYTQYYITVGVTLALNYCIAFFSEKERRK